LAHQTAVQPQFAGAHLLDGLEQDLRVGALEDDAANAEANRALESLGVARAGEQQDARRRRGRAQARQAIGHASGDKVVVEQDHVGLRDGGQRERLDAVRRLADDPVARLAVDQVTHEGAHQHWRFDEQDALLPDHPREGRALRVRRHAPRRGMRRG